MKPTVSLTGRVLQRINSSITADGRTTALWIYLFIVLSSVCISVGIESFIPLVIPAGLLLVYWSLVDMKSVLFVTFLTIPISVEFDLPGGLGLDAPVEPLTIGLLFLFIPWLIVHFRKLDGRFFLHPTTLFLFLHLAWMGLTAMNAGTLISWKFYLSKMWYVGVYMIMAFYFFNGVPDYKKLFRLILIPLLLTIIIIIIRHGVEYGYTFSDVNYVMGPFYRNHVAYASIMVVFAPFIYFLYKSERFNGKSGLIYVAAGLLLVIGVYLSFTRAAYFALLAAIGFGWIIRLRLTKLVFLTGIGMACLLVAFLVQKNRYLELAPNYERTITHNTFEDLVNATYKFQDISTMERLYRWVAAFRMIEEKPLMGYGPGSFYSEYRAYTLRKFETYVSDNPEKSGIHNYYLMITADQGIPGLILFLAFIYMVLIMGERAYHAHKDPIKKVLALSAITSIFVILVLQLMNDLIETDKIGPFFFVSLAILIHLHLNSPVVVPKQ